MESNENFPAGSTCALRGAEAKWRPDSGWVETVGRIFEAGGARMRYVCLIGLALTLSGCALERTVTFVYYPSSPHSNTFPPISEFEANAQAECARYGLVAVHQWDNWTTYQRIRSHWICVQQ